MMCHPRGPTRESLRPTRTWLRHIQATARARLWAEGRRAALGLAVGNIGGGIAAVILYHLIVIGQSTLLFVLLVLLACLLFARRIAAPAQSAPIYAIAFSTFIIILGSGLVRLPAAQRRHSPTACSTFLWASPMRLLPSPSPAKSSRCQISLKVGMRDCATRFSRRHKHKLRADLLRWRRPLRVKTDIERVAANVSYGPAADIEFGNAGVGSRLKSAIGRQRSPQPGGTTPLFRPAAASSSSPHEP